MIAGICFGLCALICFLLSYAYLSEKKSKPARICFLYGIAMICLAISLWPISNLFYAAINDKTKELKAVDESTQAKKMIEILGSVDAYLKYVQYQQNK